MVRKMLSDLIAGVCGAFAWAQFYDLLPRRRPRRVWAEMPQIPRPSPWPNVVARAEKKRAELAAKNRYGRYLDLTELDTMAWPESPELREQYESSARTIANAFQTPITLIAYDGRELAVIEPSSPELEDSLETTHVGTN
jgi:hypothetical protein